MPWLPWLLIVSLATWRLACLLHAEDGPWAIFDRLRYWAGTYREPQPFLGQLLGCFWCLSVWIGLLCGLIGYYAWPVLLPFALSGAAILLDAAIRPEN